MSEINHEEITKSLGAYALDATSDDERLAIAEHLDRCEICRNEVTEHFEIVSLLVGDGEPVPEGLWSRIVNKLEEEPPALGDIEVISAPRHRRPNAVPGNRMINVLAAITAIAALIAAIAGLGAISENGRLNKLQSRVNAGSVEQSALAASSNPANRHITLSSDDGKYQVDSVITADGQGFITGGNLPQLASDHVYQLWAESDGKDISVGLLGRKAQPIVFWLPANAVALTLTEESNTGAVSATSPYVVQGSLRT